MNLDSIFPCLIKPKSHCSWKRTIWRFKIQLVAKEGTYNNLAQGYKKYRAKASQIQSESQKQFEAIHVICGEVGKTHYCKK
jgi:hypothetical protein